MSRQLSAALSAVIRDFRRARRSARRWARMCDRCLPAGPAAEDLAQARRDVALFGRQLELAEAVLSALAVPARHTH